jgi:hypothetical protein
MFVRVKEILKQFCCYSVRICVLGRKGVLVFPGFQGYERGGMYVQYILLMKGF